MRSTEGRRGGREDRMRRRDGGMQGGKNVHRETERYRGRKGKGGKNERDGGRGEGIGEKSLYVSIPDA